MKCVLYDTRLPLKHPKSLEHQAGRALLKKGLMEEYGLAFAEEQLGKGEQGKPYLKEHSEICFSISHSEELAVCGFCEKEIGLDVQFHKKVNKRAILERIVPEELARELEDEADLTKALFVQWALREAYVKWTGEGLSRDMRTIDLEEGWHTLLDLPDGYSGALWCSVPLEVEWKFVPFAKL